MEKVNLSFDPILTIIAGVIMALIIDIFAGPLSEIIAPLIGGFIATYFAKERRVRYGLFAGIGVLLVQILFLVSFFRLNSSLFWIFIQWFFIICCFAIIGGVIGKIVYYSFNDVEDLNQ